MHRLCPTQSSASSNNPTKNIIDNGRPKDSQPPRPRPAHQTLRPRSVPPIVGAPANNPVAYSSPASGLAIPSPAAQFLLHAHNLRAADVPATGPRGRLTKADVLAALGRIPASLPQEDARRFDRFAKPDLTYTPAPVAKKAEEAPAPEKTERVEQPPAKVALALDVDLTPALRLQQRLQSAVGAAPSLATLLERAVALANSQLPAPASSRADVSSAAVLDELMDGGGPRRRGRAVVDGAFVPEINHSATSAAAAAALRGRADVLDELIAPARSRARAATVARPTVGAVNEFSVVVEEKQRMMGTVFLQRMKSLLEVEPGRLVF